MEFFTQKSACIQFTMFVSVQKVNNQAYNQPDAKSDPVGNSQFTHHVKTTGKTEYRNKR